MLIAAALLLAVQAPPTPDAAAAPAGPEIVVRARRRKCDATIADHVLSSAEFKARAAEWAHGTPVRVVAPSSADVKCLSKIAFKLGDHGVHLIEFVTPSQATPLN